MSTLFADALSLCNLASVGIFGIVLSAAFCELEWTRQRKLLFAGCTVLMLALQGVVSLRWSTSFARYLYPVITHLPLVILLVAMTRKVLWSLIAVLTAYLCCQLRRWAALLVIALFPTGGTALQDATELVVTLPLLLALVHWIAPSVRALSHSSLKLQLQFGVIPLLSYVFDYFTRIYTDLLSSGNQAAVEFMPFVCSLAYLVFVLQTTQEQKLRSQLEQTQNSLNLQVAQAVREIDALRESQRKASTYRHDLRHHLQYISACIENGRAEAAQEYIHSVCAEIEASKVNVYCENEAANLILSAFATARRTAASTSGCMPPSRWCCLCRTATCVCCFPTRWKMPCTPGSTSARLESPLLWRPPPTKRTADCFYRSQTPAASRCSSVPRASPPPASPATALACAASAPLWISMAACTAFRSSRTSLCCASLCKRSIQCILWATRANCTSRHCFCAIVSSDGSTAA